MKKDRDVLEQVLFEQFRRELKPEYPGQLSNDAYEYGYRDSLHEVNRARQELNISCNKNKVYLRSKKNFKTPKKALDDIKRQSDIRGKSLIPNHTASYWRWLVR